MLVSAHNDQGSSQTLTLDSQGDLCYPSSAWAILATNSICQFPTGQRPWGPQHGCAHANHVHSLPLLPPLLTQEGVPGKGAHDPAHRLLTAWAHSTALCLSFFLVYRGTTLVFLNATLLLPRAIYVEFPGP